MPAWKRRHLERSKKLAEAIYKRQQTNQTKRRLVSLLSADDAADITQARADLKFKMVLLGQIEAADAAKAERERAAALGLPIPPKGGRKRKRTLSEILKARDVSEKAMNAGNAFTKATDLWTGPADTDWDKLTKEEQRRVLLTDFREFCRKARIIDKKRSVIPFKWNTPQRRMNNIILSLLCARRPVRMRIAKARQWGCTTDVVYLILWLCHRHPYIMAMVVMHAKNPYIKVIREKYLFAYRSIPEWFREPLIEDTANRMAFANGAVIDFYSAGTKATADQVGRSGTYQIQHLTEVPFWFAAEATMTACMQCLADGANTVQIIESTPKGGKGEFFKLYNEAKNGESVAVAMFVPWYEIDENRVKPTDEQRVCWVNWRENLLNNEHAEKWRKRGGFGVDDENRIGRFKLQPDQWLWWWYTLKEKCGNDIERMIQEHADDDVTCFLTSGNTYFKRELLSKIAIQCNALRFQWRSAGIAEDFTFDEGTRGYHYRRKPVMKDGNYMAVLDPSDGGASSSDPSVMWILRRRGEQLEVVAWFTGQGYADEVVDQAMPLLRMYGDPLLVVEANRGAAHIVEFRKRKYPRLYRRTRINELTGQPVTDQFGWYATGSTRNTALQQLAKYVREDRLVAGIDALHAQMATFVRQEDGEKYAAKKGAHDEHVLVAAIACYVDNSLSNPDLEDAPQERVGPTLEETFGPVVIPARMEHRQMVRPAVYMDND